jgi:hypothetical protein
MEHDTLWDAMTVLQYESKSKVGDVAEILFLDRIEEALRRMVGSPCLKFPEYYSPSS